MTKELRSGIYRAPYLDGCGGYPGGKGMVRIDVEGVMAWFMLEAGDTPWHGGLAVFRQLLESGGILLADPVDPDLEMDIGL
jgi:hypothetical protein